MITQPVIKTILETIFPGVSVVPKQGNWFNPQDIKNMGTWIAFLIRNVRPRSLPFWQTGNTDTTPILTNYMIGDLELQIVGSQAEAIAQSISLWPGRPDIMDLFDTNQAQVCYDGIGQYMVSTFVQDGLSSVLAYNVRLSIQWANMIQNVQPIVTTTEITGTLTI